MGGQKGLRELGLPYVSDPAITKHLAAFLTHAAVAMNNSLANQQMARPNAVLFNGGFCAPVVTRERIVEAISAWFSGAQNGWRPEVLKSEAVDSAVARGAAYYGSVRRGTGLRIKAGSARTYYIGLGSDDGLQGICVLPAGVEEGTTLPILNRDFSVLAKRPVSFTLYSSRTRHDAHGEVAALDEASAHRLPPLVTLLRYGRENARCIPNCSPEPPASLRLVRLSSGVNRGTPRIRNMVAEFAVDHRQAGTAEQHACVGIGPARRRIRGVVGAGASGESREPRGRVVELAGDRDRIAELAKVADGRPRKGERI